MTRTRVLDEAVDVSDDGVLARGHGRWSSSSLSRRQLLSRGRQPARAQQPAPRVLLNFLFIMFTAHASKLHFQSGSSVPRS
eukprot:4281420-Prymnesium_polylepis.1